MHGEKATGHSPQQFAFLGSERLHTVLDRNMESLQAQLDASRHNEPQNPQHKSYLEGLLAEIEKLKGISLLAAGTNPAELASFFESLPSAERSKILKVASALESIDNPDTLDLISSGLSEQTGESTKVGNRHNVEADEILQDEESVVPSLQSIPPLRDRLLTAIRMGVRETHEDLAEPVEPRPLKRDPSGLLCLD